MAVYKYQGRNKKGERITGKVKADSEREAKQLIREKGTAVTHMEELNSVLYKDLSFGTKRIKSQDFVIYLRQFSTLLQAGISVVDATSILAEQTASKALKAGLADIEEDLRAGNPFSEAAEKQRKLFPPLFINMMRAGELGGNLDEILDRLASYYEKQHRTKQKVMSALSYPIAVGLVAIIVVIFLLSFVVPTFADMFAGFGADLPFITVLVLQAGNIASAYWWGFLLLLVGLYLFWRVIKEQKDKRYAFDFALLRLPLFGKLFQKAALARLTRTLSSLFASSVPILQALAITERIVGNEVIAKVIRDCRQSIEKGESIAAPMETHWAFPPLVTQMIAVGEKTGSLDQMLDKVADFYEAEVEASTDQIKSLIEPLMIVLLAGVVGIIVAAIAIPMFEIFDSIG
ncbi:type II secretion system F family protein [Halalkalibacter okhensis]|uniref:Type II secretion system protein F n=1 Tax=Halalkalibacter okhensis TaxID=333138 RepID=A0A0B0II44_9BACI|nr:type II secretion system F family protein [Halalkalibacter okhensis]KHF40950.1 type II secretion system protein F [Halalkalibacter okhensis]